MRYTLECDKCRKEFEIGCTLKEFENHRSGKKKIKCPICRRPLKQVLSPLRFKLN